MSDAPKPPYEPKVLDYRLRSLTPQQRVAIHLNLVNGMNQEEIGRHLGRSQSSINGRLQPARRKLQGKESKDKPDDFRPDEVDQIMKALQAYPYSEEERAALVGRQALLGDEEPDEAEEDDPPETISEQLTEPNSDGFGVGQPTPAEPVEVKSEPPVESLEVISAEPIEPVSDEVEIVQPIPNQPVVDSADPLVDIVERARAQLSPPRPDVRVNWRPIAIITAVVGVLLGGLLLLSRFIGERQQLTAPPPNPILTQPGQDMETPTQAVADLQVPGTEVSPDELRPTTVPRSSPVPEPTTVAVEATKTFTYLTFSDPAYPKRLTPIWRYGRGAEGNRYEIDADNRLTLISGRGTRLRQGFPTAPRVILPIRGNFDLKTRLDFAPGNQIDQAGLRVESDHVNGGTFEFYRTVNPSGEQILELNANTRALGLAKFNAPYPQPFVYLRVIREGDRLSFLGSEDNVNWFVLREGDFMPMNDVATITLFYMSDAAAVAPPTFSELGLSLP